jgi:cytochrome c oxidase subunit 1
MKNFFLRVENWLLIIPAILLVVEKLFFGAAVFDLHLHDTYFVISGFYIGLGMFVVVLIPYLCHLLLRLHHKRNRRILVVHVMATVLLLLFLFIAVRQNNETPNRYYDFSNWESFQQFERLNYYLGIAVLAFTGMQLLFILYTIVKLIAKK